jgi:hypothetical protein
VNWREEDELVKGMNLELSILFRWLDNIKTCFHREEERSNLALNMIALKLVKTRDQTERERESSSSSQTGICIFLRFSGKNVDLIIMGLKIHINVLPAGC